MSQAKKGFYAHPKYYDILFGWDRTQEIFFLDKLFQHYELQVGAPLLEVACGTGIVARQLSLLGWDLYGMDISPEMLSYLNLSCQSQGGKVTTFHGDMTNFSMDSLVQGAFIPLGSLGLLGEDEKVKAHLQCMARHMNDGGVYLLDMGFKKGETAPSPYDEIEWSMERDGLIVDAVEGKVNILNSAGEVLERLEWEAVPLVYNWQHFEDIIDSSGVFEIITSYPEASLTEEGVSVFDVNHHSNEPMKDRAMVALRKK
ncbi:MAG: class I SAM-dependent methyltransferase [Planctomycetes bacterium]|nr:class I SAM-dependent methyltransferase [Planctomycetota bacterium]